MEEKGTLISRPGVKTQSNLLCFFNGKISPVPNLMN